MMNRNLKLCFCLLSLWFVFSSSQVSAAGHEDFYKDLEYLLYNYGNDAGQWPECEQKQKVEYYIRVNFKVGLNETIFGENLLGYGVFHSPEDARIDQLKGGEDAWGKPYDRIVASSPDGNRLLDAVRSAGNNLGVDFYNREIKNKLFIFLKADLHSQFSDVFRNFNGKELRIVAREINIMGAPGSAHKNYLDDISPALEAGHNTRAKIWVGDKDKITRLPSNVKTTQKEGLLGLKWEFKFGSGGPNISKVYLEDVGHVLEDYKKGIQKEMNRPVYVITTKKGLRVLTDEQMLKVNPMGVNKWQKISDEDGWVLVGHEGEHQSEWVAILVTKPDDSPSMIAARIRKRNDREHPGEQAIVLLDGNPNSERNKALADALKSKGYKAEDILVVSKGDLYTIDGMLVGHGGDFLPKGVENDPVLAQGIWGHILRNFTGRSVYGDPAFGTMETTKDSVRGVYIDPKPTKAGKGGAEIKEKVLGSRPSGDSPSWSVDLPEGIK